jgi:hypothetical protein
MKKFEIRDFCLATVLSSEDGRRIPGSRSWTFKTWKNQGSNLCGWVARKSLVRVEIQVFVCIDDKAEHVVSGKTGSTPCLPE